MELGDAAASTLSRADDLDPHVQDQHPHTAHSFFPLPGTL